MSRGPSHYFVRKSSGERSQFDSGKLLRSLMKSGASREVAETILIQIEEELEAEMVVPTHKIYQKAFRLLKKTAAGQAARYKLKKAIMELGPTGYPFEKYFAEVMKTRGYHTRVGVILEGRCVSHEVDVLAQLGNKKIFVECKFHNRSGYASDVKVPLYIHSRFNDILAAVHEREHLGNTGEAPDGYDYEGWIVTNTRFTDDARKYAQCSHLKLIGWDYPEKESLRDMIDQAQLHPVTCLTSLNNHDKNDLLTRRVVLVRELKSDQRIIDSMGFSTRKRKKIFREIEGLIPG